MHMRAQGSLEYLVMLAVVLTVALVSVALLGFFPGLTPDARLKQSEAYWKGTEPFAVVETHAWTDGRLTLVVANRRAEGLVLNDVDICVLQACTSYLASPVYFSPGQQQQVTLQGPPLPNLASATGICERRIEFGYSSSNLPALRQIGERDLVLRCPESLSGPPPPACTPPCIPLGGSGCWTIPGAYCESGNCCPNNKCAASCAAGGVGQYCGSDADCQAGLVCDTVSFTPGQCQPPPAPVCQHLGDLCGAGYPSCCADELLACDMSMPTPACISSIGPACLPVGFPCSVPSDCCTDQGLTCCAGLCQDSATCIG